MQIINSCSDWNIHTNILTINFGLYDRNLILDSKNRHQKRLIGHYKVYFLQLQRSYHRFVVCCRNYYSQTFLKYKNDFLGIIRRELNSITDFPSPKIALLNIHQLTIINIYDFFWGIRQIGRNIKCVTCSIKCQSGAPWWTCIIHPRPRCWPRIH